MSFVRSFESILDGLLTDYRNLCEASGGVADVSVGSQAYVNYSALASCVWGLYNQIENASRNIFPDTADTASLEHWASVYGMSRLSGENDHALLMRLLLRIRRPPAGGNKYDFERWAVECRIDADGNFVPPDDLLTTAYSDVGAAYCYPRAQGPGTVDVAIVLAKNVRILVFAVGGYVDTVAGDIGKTVLGSTSGDTGTLLAVDNIERRWWVRCASPNAFDSIEIAAVQGGTGSGTMLAQSITDLPYWGLVLAVQAYVESVQPVELAETRIIGVTRRVEPITVALTGAEPGAGAGAAEDIAAYVNSMAPGATLHRSKIAAIAIDAGAANAVVSTPAADVASGVYEVIRPGLITVG